MNLITDALVSRYERNAPRDPGADFLQGATPRELGPPDAGRAVLFIHGFIGAQSNFNDLPDRVAEDGWFVRTMRLPGHGSSPRDFERTSTEDLIAGVREEVRALPCLSRVVLVGHSWAARWRDRRGRRTVKDSCSALPSIDLVRHPRLPARTLRPIDCAHHRWFRAGRAEIR